MRLSNNGRTIQRLRFPNADGGGSDNNPYLDYSFSGIEHSKGEIGWSLDCVNDFCYVAVGIESLDDLSKEHEAFKFLV